MRLNEQMRRLNVVYMSGAIPDTEYLRESKKLKTAIENAKIQEASEKPIDVSALKDFLTTDFEGIYQTLSMEDKRRLWRSIIKAIHFSGLTVDHIDFRTE